MKIQSYKQGTPSWIDLSTTDVDGAKAFYAALFGWDYQDNPMGEGQVYSMAQIDGSAAGAMYTQQKEETEMGLPPYWKVYITVDDVEAIAAKAPELGATLVMEPFDVLDAGRMCIVQDPTGAVIQFWQAKAHIGCEVRDQHGALTWTELLTTDQQGASAFYSALLDVGMDKETMPTPEGENYHMFTVDGEPVAGIMVSPQHLIDMNVPPHWEVYFWVDDAREVVEKAKSMGAHVMFGPEVLPMVGTFAALIGPQGAVFGVHQLPTG